jgi:hypothetical protein
MDFADDAEELARDGSGVADGGEDATADAEYVPGGAEDVPGHVSAHAEDIPGESGDVSAYAEDVPDESGDVSAYAEGFPDDPGEVSGYADDSGADEVRAQARPSTGEPRVDAALARLDELEGRPVSEHRAVFEDVHRRLRDVLGELDSRQQPQSRDATDPAGRPGR